MKGTHDVSRRVASSLLMCCALVFSTGALSAGVLGQGRVSMEGAIFESPCTILVGEPAQSVAMESLLIEQLAREGQGPEMGFAIRLVDCVLPRPDLGRTDGQRFQMTFDGERDDAYFGVTGTAQGVALRIQDGQGQTARPGEALPVAWIPGDPTLHFRANLVSNRAPLKAGEYHSAIRFRLDYY